EESSGRQEASFYGSSFSPADGFPSINHAYHNDRFDVSGPNRESECERKNRLFNPHAHGVARDCRLAAIPNRAGIVEGLKGPISILDAVMKQPVSANGIYVVFIPASQVIAVAR